MERPLANSYWVLEGQLLAGEHPLGREAQLTTVGSARLQSLLDAGINSFVDLTEAGECPSYAGQLGPDVSYVQHAIRDQDVPGDPQQMRQLLDHIAAALESGRRVYVHCRAGIGRTGTAMGCYLVERGQGGERALRDLNALWSTQSARAATWPQVPQTEQQADFIRSWRARTAAIGAAGAEVSDAQLKPVRDLRERFQGALQGLAVGDAMAAATQFRRPGSFAAVGDVLGGGPYDLPRGAWSDDTAMALCLAASLTERDGFDSTDQLARYRRWQREGYLSATGQCVGITANTAQALADAPTPAGALGRNALPSAGGVEALSRVAPAVMYAFADPARAVVLAAAAASTTCRSPLVIDACRAWGAMLHAALRGEPREAVLHPATTIFGARPLLPELTKWLAEVSPDGAQRGITATLVMSMARALAAGTGVGSGGGADAGGDVLAVLTLARWAFASSTSFREGALRAANLGGCSDIVGAAYGQLAGAFYGVSAIPPGWRQALAQRELIEQLADALLRDALLQLGGTEAVA